MGQAQTLHPHPAHTCPYASAHLCSSQQALMTWPPTTTANHNHCRRTHTLCKMYQNAQKYTPVQQPAGNHDLVTQLQGAHGADLELPLPRHHLGVDARDDQAGLQGCVGVVGERGTRNSQAYPCLRGRKRLSLRGRKRLPLRGIGALVFGLKDDHARLRSIMVGVGPATLYLPHPPLSFHHALSLLPAPTPP